MTKVSTSRNSGAGAVNALRHLGFGLGSIAVGCAIMVGASAPANARDYFVPVTLECNKSKYIAPNGGRLYLNVVAMPEPGNNIASALFSGSKLKAPGKVKPGGTDGGVEVNAGNHDGTATIVYVVEDWEGNTATIHLNVTVVNCPRPDPTPPDDPPKKPQKVQVEVEEPPSRLSPNLPYHGRYRTLNRRLLWEDDCEGDCSGSHDVVDLLATLPPDEPHRSHGPHETWQHDCVGRCTDRADHLHGDTAKRSDDAVKSRDDAARRPVEKHGPQSQPGQAGGNREDAAQRALDHRPAQNGASEARNTRQPSTTSTTRATSLSPNAAPRMPNTPRRLASTTARAPHIQGMRAGSAAASRFPALASNRMGGLGAPRMGGFGGMRMSGLGGMRAGGMGGFARR